MSALIHSSSNAYHTAYQTNVVSPVTYMPAMVTNVSNGLSFNIEGVTVTAQTADGTPAPIAFPRQPKNTLCACGSKKRYRRCHGRKR